MKVGDRVQIEAIVTQTPDGNMIKCETESTHEIVWCTADELSEVGDDRRSISTAIRAAKD